MNNKYYIDKHTEDIEPHFHIVGKSAGVSLINAEIVHGDNDLTNGDIANIDNDMNIDNIRCAIINEWKTVNNIIDTDKLSKPPIYYRLIPEIKEGPKNYNKHSYVHIGRNTCERLGFLSPDDLKTPIFIRMYNKDYNPPHFHVVGKDGKTIACLELLNAEYYDHGYKRDTVLSDKMLEMIDNMLRRKFYPTVSMYRMMLRHWRQCTGYRVDALHEQPDYTKTIRHK